MKELVTEVAILSAQVERNQPTYFGCRTIDQTPPRNRLLSPYCLWVASCQSASTSSPNPADQSPMATASRRPAHSLGAPMTGTPVRKGMVTAKVINDWTIASGTKVVKNALVHPDGSCLTDAYRGSSFPEATVREITRYASLVPHRETPAIVTQPGRVMHFKTRSSGTPWTRAGRMIDA